MRCLSLWNKPDLNHQAQTSWKHRITGHKGSYSYRSWSSSTRADVVPHDHNHNQSSEPWTFSHWPQTLDYTSSLTSFVKIPISSHASHHQPSLSKVSSPPKGVKAASNTKTKGRGGLRRFPNLTGRPFYMARASSPALLPFLFFLLLSPAGRSPVFIWCTMKRV
jgi:hypothetical protein